MTNSAPNDDALTLDDFPIRTFDKVRYADTDRQGHVNNAAFATFLETGRVEVLYAPDAPLADTGASFVIARLVLDFVSEAHWPGTIDVGTGVSKIGNSSLHLTQGLFQSGRAVARAHTVIVHVDGSTQRSTPLTDHARTILESLTLPGSKDHA